MTDENNSQPFRPPVRTSNHYRHFTEEITGQSHTKESVEPFTLVITATNNKEKIMDEKQFLVEMAFKPKDPNLKLNLEQSQLILSHVGELLKEIEAEEKRITEEQNTSENKDDMLCK
jgi:uncharacterized protein (DUF849 family)